MLCNPVTVRWADMGGPRTHSRPNVSVRTGRRIGRRVHGSGRGSLCSKTAPLRKPQNQVIENSTLLKAGNGHPGRKMLYFQSKVSFPTQTSEFRRISSGLRLGRIATWPKHIALHKYYIVRMTSELGTDLRGLNSPDASPGARDRKRTAETQQGVQAEA
jgi:hypothetical protein